MAIIWDNDFSESSFTEQPAIMGFDFLETPNNQGLANFSVFGPGGPNEFASDVTQYNLLSDPGSSFETDQAQETRMLIFTGSFDLNAGASVVGAGALLFGRAPEGTTMLATDPITFRPDPNDPVLADLLEIQDEVQEFYDENLKGPGLPKYADLVNDAESAAIPKEYALSQNHPNPFNPETEIRFQLPKAGHVLVKIFNIMGEEVRTLVEAEYEAGYHGVRWDGKDKNSHPVASGVYLYQLQAGGFSQVRKMSLLR